MTSGSNVGRLRHALTRLPQQTLIAVIRGYRLLLKPWLGNACRFEPTCSAYALQALQAHGAAAGTWLSTRRLLRCHPWCAGGFDPVPERFDGTFGRRVRYLPTCRCSGPTKTP